MFRKKLVTDVAKGPEQTFGYMSFGAQSYDFVSAHTQDNSFLGFVIGSNENLKDIDVTKRKPKALIYAKRASYLQVILILLFNTISFLEPQEFKKRMKFPGTTDKTLTIQNTTAVTTTYIQFT